MKNPYLIQIIFLAFGALSTAQAQQFKTDQSIIKQLKEGTVPGLVFAPKQQAKPAVDTAVNNKITGESFGKLYKSGKLPGVQYAPVQPATKSNTTKLQSGGTSGNTTSKEPATKPTSN